MSKYLLLIAVGPVQEFIAQARRTRDLWYGSHLLSELCRAAAKAVAEQGGKLIFPALKWDDADDRLELEPCDQLLRPKQGRLDEPPLSIANKILAEVEGDPRPLAEAARAAIAQRLADVANGTQGPEPRPGVRQKCAGLLASGIDNVWREQLKTLPEFYAAWVPLNGSYRAAREQVEQALGGRKNLREFGRWQATRGGVPKSTLDGARETVLREPEGPGNNPPFRDPELVRKYRLGQNEQLDAVGLLKRAGGEPKQFVPLATIAFGPWLKLADEEVPQALAALETACKGIHLTPVERRDLPCAQAFHFDAQVLLPDRWKPLFEELGRAKEEAREWGDTHVRPVLKPLSDPYPYVACLVADGDKMGKALAAMADPEQHRDFSRRLAKFPALARTVVERQHLGALVYSGGDDVLAFLPLTEAVACAAALRHTFGELMAGACATPPTLSVGLAIGHLLDGMGELLQLGRDAEELAKVDRNSLGVLLDKRSGGRLSWTAGWPTDPAGRLGHDQRRLSKDGWSAPAEGEGEPRVVKLSVKKVYELGTLWRRLPKPKKVLEADWPAWADLLRREVGRILARVQGGEQKLTPADVELELDGPYAALYAAVRDWVDRLRIATALAEAVPQLRGDGHE